MKLTNSEGKEKDLKVIDVMVVDEEPALWDDLVIGYPTLKEHGMLPEQQI